MSGTEKGVSGLAWSRMERYLRTKCSHSALTLISLHDSEGFREAWQGSEEASPP